MNSVSATPQQSAQPVPGAGWRDRSLLRHMTLLDPAMLYIWVIVSTLPLPGVTPLRYLCVAYFTAGSVLFARQTIPTFVRAWPLLIIPILCLTSALWAPSPNDAIRKAIFMLLTGVIAVYVASRMDGRKILAMYFCAEILGALITLANPNVSFGTWNGPYGQKNYLAVQMFILYAPGLALLLDKNTDWRLRAAAALFVPVAAFIILMSKSSTTLLFMIIATVALLAHAFLWQPAQRVRHMRALILMFLALLALTAFLLLFGLLQVDVTKTLLDALGKDSTLTGRTFIWDWGNRIIRENPWTGVGADGFWRPEIGIANQITTYFFYETFVHFSFHNSFIENGVQFGYPGYYATIFIAGWGLVCAARNWMRNQTLINATFLIMCAMIVIRSNTEIDLAMVLSGTLILFCIGALRDEKKEDRNRPVQPKRTQAPASSFGGLRR